jgi:glycosyltransferase involved in cell wall biosynthesis
MLTPTLVLQRRIAEKSPKTFNILTCCTHEGYQTLLGETGHNFYMLTGQGLKGWDFHTRPLPKNHYIHMLPPEKLRPEVGYDLVLCQNRLGQYPLLASVASRLGLPIIMIDHTEPPPGLTKAQMREIKSWRADKHVFITEHNKKTWEGKPEDIVIPHGINTDKFKGYTGEIPTGLSVVNKFPNRDIFCGWELWKQITSVVPVTLVGDNPGLSESINDVDKLIAKYASHRFFLNTSQLSPVPLSLLEAMAVGCPVVSSAKQEIPKIIKHGENGFLYDDPCDAVKYCKWLINDPAIAKEIGEKGRQTVIERFSHINFVQQWNKVFTETYEGKR